MSRFVALLRAINVGGHSVKMHELRSLFEALGFAGVETFIASGNVIFDTLDTDASVLERRIEAHLEQSLGFPVATFLRSVSEIAAVAAYRPFPAADLGAAENALYVAFLPAPPNEAARQRLFAFRSEVDDFQVHGREVYWTLPQDDQHIRVLGSAAGKDAEDARDDAQRHDRPEARREVRLWW